MTMRGTVATGVRATALLGVAALAAAATGRPMLFPSLGPSAYAMAVAGARATDYHAADERAADERAADERAADHRDENDRTEDDRGGGRSVSGPTGTRPHEVTVRDLLGGHFVGVVAGLIAYHLVAGGTTMVAAGAPFSAEAVLLAASGLVAVGLTTAGMLATGWRHAPACATTLIVGLGLLPAPADGALVLASVASLAVLREGFARAGAW